MKRYVCLLIILIGFSIPVISQSKDLNDFSYIIVPEKFDFLREVDQFQLNSLTKFLLNKHGFYALFNNEVPDNVKRCEGLWAEVEKSSGLVYTNLEVVIKDCKGNELYRSFKGKSKFKKYNKAYQDALRKAFKSFESLNVDQPEIALDEEEDSLNAPILKDNNIDEELDQSNNKKEVVSINNNRSDYYPSSLFSSYTNNGFYYLLRKTKEGYILYEESRDGDLLIKGYLMLKNSKLNYQDLEKNIFDAYFDSIKNLNVFVGDKAKVYILKDQ